MRPATKSEFNLRYICLSAYKVLLLLKFLLYSPLTVQQIFEIFEKDAFVNQQPNKNALRLFSKSLRKIGCKIEKPTILNKNRYILNENPFLIDFNEDEINLLNKFRNNPYEKNNWKSILNSNSLINKICLIINNKSTIEKLKSENSLSQINPDTILELNELCKNRKTALFRYFSGLRLCNFEMITSFLKYENDKLYIWGFSPIFQELSYIRVDKIKKISTFDVISPKITNKEIIRYKIFNKNYIPNENEYIVEKTDEYLVIDYKILNYFHTIQYFLEKGDECKIISPEAFKSDVISIAEEIKKGYFEDDK